MTSTAATPKPRSPGKGALPGSTAPAVWQRCQAFAERHPRRAWCAVWLLTFSALVAWRGEVLYSPPYWDYAMGLFAEADFLVESNFDYSALVEQRRFGAGGVATYITSIMPTFVALVMKFSPSVSASLLILHLVNIAAAASALLLVYALLRPHVEPQLAALAALAVLTTPLFASQVDMTGMDMVLTAVALLALGCFLANRYVAAWLLAALAFGVKASGMLAIVVMILHLVAQIIADRGPRGAALHRRRFVFLGAALLLLSVEWGINNWLKQLTTSGSEQLRARASFGWETLQMTRIWCPDLLVVFAASVALLLVGGALGWRRQWKREGRLLGSGWRATTDWLRQQPLEAAAWLMVFGALAAMLLAYAIPRYFLLPLPLLWIAATLALRRCLPVVKAVTAVLVVACAVNLLNERGRFFPALGSNDRTGAMLERSREYLLDHLSNQILIRGLENGFADQPIVAGNPFVYFLALPRLGYLKQGKPLYGYSLNTFSPPTFPDVRRLVRDAPREPLFLWAQNTFTNVGWCTVPPPEAKDSALFKDAQGSHPVVLYRKKSWTEEEAKLPLARRYRKWLFADDPGLIAEFEIETPEQQAAAEKQLRQELAENAQDADARHNLGVVLARQQRLDEAQQEYRHVLELRPRRADTHCRLADVLADLEQPDEAAAEYRLALKYDEEMSDAHKGLGIVLARKQKYAEAQQSLRRAAELQPFDASVWFQLGMSQRLAGDAVAAGQSFREAIERRRDDADSLLQLGILEEERGRESAAVGYYRRAVTARPNLPAALNNLAWLLATSPQSGVRNGKEAVKTALTVCHLTGNGVYGLLDTLAAAYAEAGKFAEAVEAAQRAAELADQAGQTDEAEQIRTRLKLYENKQPFHRAEMATPSASP